MSEQNQDTVTPLIGRYFDIESVTAGGGKLPYLTRYVGKLRTDSERAHRELSAALKPQRYTVLFRNQDDKHVIELLPGLPKPRRSNPLINLIFFILTVASVIFTGVQYAQESSPSSDIWQVIASGVPYAIALLGILLAHEFGHYLAARYHKTDVTLPYFLPMPAPISPFGTLGAFIQLKAPPRNKKVLFDIGVAGPLAGLVIAVPVLLIGLSLSKLDTIPSFIAAGDGFSLEGNSILYLVSKYLIFRQWLPMPVSYGGVEPFIYWARYIFTGLPSPLGGTDVFLHSVAWAGWAGLLVTSMNLIPVGQLDGGHILYSLLGKHVNKLRPFIIGGLVLLGFFFSGWWLWVFLILFMGSTHAEPLDQITQLDGPRKALGIFAIIIFFLVFTPIPLKLFIGPFGGP
jgi:membrane-associated protease RseP (regulator of RpoE activity)